MDTQDLPPSGENLDQPTPTEITRRNFLLSLGGFGGLMAFGNSICNISVNWIPAGENSTSDESSTAYVMPGVEQREFEVAEREGDVVIIGSVEDFPAGTVTHYRRFRDGRFYLMRFPDGAFLALSRRCTHNNCSVPWVPDSQRFICPCHDSMYDSTGAVIQGPAPAPLSLYPITITDGIIRVDTGNPVDRIVVSPTDFVYANS